METDALLGVVVRVGRQLDVSTPVTSVLYALLTAIDAQPAAATSFPPMDAGTFAPQ
jgi:ketopantoate reductase